MNQTRAFTLTLAPVRPATIDSTALAAWADSEVPYYQILDPESDSPNDDLPNLLYDAIERGVFSVDPTLTVELHTALYVHDPGYIITVRNRHDPAPGFGISSKRTPLIPATAELSLADAISHYLSHIRDITNSLLGHPADAEAEPVDPDAPRPPLSALEYDIPFENEFGSHPTISLLLAQRNALESCDELGGDRVDALTEVTTALTGHRQTLTPATPEHTELDTVLTELAAITAELGEYPGEDTILDAFAEACALLERPLHHAIPAARAVRAARR
ncbi:hypothetical protein [Nocardia suismassiliense]|uniref:hypothetical protein n=1 Tax=Nocardia suismassiliense TaxID=2077092 RepID=UPI000D1F94F8|nr:hypothetical protein [Nocardia suismassiliense]